jgi:hypothetical protein
MIFIKINLNYPEPKVQFFARFGSRFWFYPEPKVQFFARFGSR